MLVDLHNHYICLVLVKISEKLKSKNQYELSDTIIAIQRVIEEIETSQQSNVSHLKKLLSEMKMLEKC